MVSFSENRFTTFFIQLKTIHRSQLNRKEDTKIELRVPMLQCHNYRSSSSSSKMRRQTYISNPPYACHHHNSLLKSRARRVYLFLREHHSKACPVMVSVLESHHLTTNHQLNHHHIPSR